MEDIEAIFRDELENFFVSKDKVKAHLASANEHLLDMKARLAAHSKQLEKTRAEMRKTYQLYQTDQISPEGFGKLYRPLEDQDRALSAELPKLQGQVDAIEIHQLAADDVVTEASNLHTRWPTFNQEEKRRIIESITEKIVVKGDEIDITLCYMPSSEELTNRQRNLCAMLPLYERSMRIARDKYLPSHNRGIQVPQAPNTIGGHLRRRRLQLKIFQPEAARRLAVSTVSLSRWECDKVIPTAPHQPQIVAYLGFNPFKIGTK